MHASLEGLHRDQDSEWSALENHILRKYDQNDYLDRLVGTRVTSPPQSGRIEARPHDFFPDSPAEEPVMCASCVRVSLMRTCAIVHTRRNHPSTLQLVRSPAGGGQFASRDFDSSPLCRRGSI
jgi:hypothetical protein